MSATELAITALNWMWNNPEVTPGQPETLAYIKKIVEREMPDFFQIHEVEGAGMWFDWGPDSKVLSIADVDAITIGETDGHFCGHNANTARNIGCMLMLYEMVNSGQVPQNGFGIRFAFETDEDGGHLQTPGIHALIEAGMLENVRCAIKTHFCCPLPPNPTAPDGIPLIPARFMIADGAVTAYAAVLDIRINGVGGHPSMIGPNSVLPVRDRLNTFLNERKERYKVCVTLGLHEGADRVNVEPSQVNEQGAVLCFDIEAAHLLFEDFEGFVEEVRTDWIEKCTPNAKGVSKIEVGLTELYLPTINDMDFAKNARDILEDNRSDCLVPSMPVPAGETAGHVSEQVPMIFIYCGTTTEAMPHQPTFRIVPEDLEPIIPAIFRVLTEVSLS